MTSFRATPIAIMMAMLLAIKTTKSEATIDNDNASSRLSIHIPHSLYKEEGYDHREALFGISPYGGSITEHLYYADSDLCDPTVDTRKGYPTRDVDEHGTMRPWPSPYILMVDRGRCTFVQKVRNAQRSGAAGVIIADNTCLCSSLNCTSSSSSSSPPQPCQTIAPSMADDGSGTDITIPSFLMFKTDADAVKREVKNNDQIVQIEMAWSLPSPDDRVEYDLWTVPSDRFSEPFVERFRSVAVQLDDRAYFTPYMYLIDGTLSGCHLAGDPDRYEGCDRVCTNGGRYCAIDPDIKTDIGVSGHDVILESLRRICIWRHYGEADGVGVVWWDYVTEFQRRCDGGDDGDENSSSFADDDCIHGVYRRVGVDERVVDQCIHDSGGVASDQPNILLDAELEAQSRRGVVRLPSIFVNTVALQGALTVGNVFFAICAGYLAGTEPEICKRCAVCPDKVSCAMEGECQMGGVGGDDGTNVSFFWYCFSMLAVVGVLGGVGVLYYRRNREQMREQVRGILAEYVPLEDQEVNVNGCNGVNPSLEFAQRYGNT